MKVMFLDVFNDLNSLDSVSVLEEGLKHTASVMLKYQLRVLGANELQALFYDGVFLVISDFGLLLLNEKLGIVDL